MILTADYQRQHQPDPIAQALGSGLGILGQAIQNSISLGKGRADLQNSQGGQFFDLLNQQRQFAERKYEFGVGQQNTDRAFNRGVLESDRGFDRNVLTSDRAFGRGVFESDRGFNYGKERDTVKDGQFAVETSLRASHEQQRINLLSNEDTRRAAEAKRDASRFDNTEADRKTVLEDRATEKGRIEAANQRVTSLFTESKAGLTVTPDTSQVTLQDFVANHKEVKDTRVGAAVDVAKIELSRRSNETTVTGLSAEIETLHKEISRYREALNPPEGSPVPSKQERVALTSAISKRQAAMDEIVAKYPELGTVRSKLAEKGAAPATDKYTN